MIEIIICRVLKDVPMSTKELFVRRRTDRDCLQVFPELDYLHLYETVVSIIDAAPFITTGQHGNKMTLDKTVFIFVTNTEHIFKIF